MLLERRYGSDQAVTNQIPRADGEGTEGNWMERECQVFPWGLQDRRQDQAVVDVEVAVVQFNA